MNKTDELLVKYFAGNSSLQEEKELKTYFGGNNVAAEHQKYIPLFQAFANEKKTETSVGEIKTTRRFSLRRRIIAISASAAAACVIALFVFFHQPKNESYLIIHGKRINNAEMAENFANKKLQNALQLTKQNLNSLNQNKLIKKELQELNIQN